MKFCEPYTTTANQPENGQEARERAKLVGSTVAKAIKNLKEAVSVDPMMEDESGDAVIKAFRQLQFAVNSAEAHLNWFTEYSEYNEFFEGLQKPVYIK